MMKILSKNNGLGYGSDVKPLELTNHNSVESYLDQNKNQTQYVVMFCHEQWDEKLQFESYNVNKSDPELAMETVTKEFDWYLPC